MENNLVTSMFRLHHMQVLKLDEPVVCYHSVLATMHHPSAPCLTLPQSHGILAVSKVSLSPLL